MFGQFLNALEFFGGVLWQQSMIHAVNIGGDAAGEVGEFVGLAVELNRVDARGLNNRRLRCGVNAIHAPRWCREGRFMLSVQKKRQGEQSKSKDPVTLHKAPQAGNVCRLYLRSVGASVVFFKDARPKGKRCAVYNASYAFS